jgi:hypothetical protein
MENHDPRAAGGGRNHLTAGALEGYQRNGLAVPGHGADVPRWRARHFRGRLESNHLGVLTMAIR